MKQHDTLHSNRHAGQRSVLHSVVAKIQEENFGFHKLFLDKCSFMLTSVSHQIMNEYVSPFRPKSCLQYNDDCLGPILPHMDIQ